ncbi:MAG: monovalent cation:proton antiporter-2 (CPA2) family protein [Sedimenticola sp.]
MTETHYLVDILILLGVTVIAVPLFQRLGLGSVLGYLAAGAAVGPWGLQFIDQTEEIRHIAEFGVVFLLFIIGIELRPARLWSMRRTVFGLGTAQVMLTGLAIAGLTVVFLDQPLRLAVIIGFGLALSSTAFGLQILTERGEMNTEHGRTAFSVLLLQDLAVVPLLTLVSLLATDTTTLLEGIEFAILDAILVIALVIIVGRFLLTPILGHAARCRTAEVFTAAAVFVVLGTAWLLETVGLSLALGAFLAGLMLAESQYRHQVIADIEPFRGILLGLFFMAVGMSIDFGLLQNNGLLIAGLVIGLLLVKSAIMWSISRVAGVSAVNATRASLLLSQSGEFGFVLFGLAAVSGLLDEELFQFLILIVVLSMVSTPFMHRLGESLGKRSRRKAGSHDISVNHLAEKQPHIIIAGFGRVGRRVAKLLETAQLPYLAIEKDADRILEGRNNGFSVFYGDASHVDVLKAAGAGNAAVLVCTLDNTLHAVRIVSILKQHYPDIVIHARGHDSHHCEQLIKAGANSAISETLEESLQLGSAVLHTMEVMDDDISNLVETFRRDYYREPE